MWIISRAGDQIADRHVGCHRQRDADMKLTAFAGRAAHSDLRQSHRRAVGHRIDSQLASLGVRQVQHIVEGVQ
ncbi:hypothetical protein WT27_12560 [Burkholderia territorii]|uniref:Uncharacterized protein n=1 Tax=Burkholderia territorii TaxID=1503055 RepID=A0A106DWK9_9BURK|nr:hypothetical protein WT27_12560 [Burkholderia territorii]KVX36581.1 hypothetical protein WT31_05480 [Burkholderia territorii]